MLKKAAAIVGLMLTCAPALGAEIRTTSERLDDGVVSIATQSGRLVVTTTGGRKLALEDVKEIRFADRAPARLRDVHLWLLSGEELNGTVGDEVKQGDTFVLSTVSLGRLEVPLDLVGAMVFDVTAEQEDRFARRHLGWLTPGRGTRPQHDGFTLLEGGGRSGRIDRLSRDGLEFSELDRKTAWPTFPLKRLESIVLGGKPLARGAAGLRVLLRLADGSVAIGPVVKLEAGKLTLSHSLGKKGELEVDMTQVLALEVLGGAVAYLSDLAPVAVEETFPEPFERDADLFSWKRDREVLGAAPLRLGGKTYRKGLGVHARSSLAFDLRDGRGDGAYRELRAVVGLDDTTKLLGEAQGLVPSVTFRVIVDGKTIKEITKARGDAPDEISVPVAGAKKVTLLVDCGEWFHVLGRADWADAHLVK
ncbi:MAG: NPCBM/NEW2 domain-containing protein [Planctomycetota bacterium]